MTGCNIGCKTLFSERGKLPLKLTCPTSTSTCPATLLNKGKIGLCPKHNLPSGASGGLVQLAPLPLFAKFTCNLQQGQWLCCTLHDILFIFLRFYNCCLNIKQKWALVVHFLSLILLSLICTYIECCLYIFSSYELKWIVWCSFPIENRSESRKDNK